MTKQSEKLNVVSSEPLDSIDDSSEKETTVATADKESSTSEENKQETTEESTKESKSADSTSETKSETKPESKKDRKTVSFKKEIDSTEEVPINEEEQDESVPPPQPPRPKDPTQQIIEDMKQAFPNIEEKYIIATLIASQGNPDPAFNALLYISDPTFKPEIPVYKPPISTSSTGSIGTGGGGGRNLKELTDDELLARKLQKEFELEDERNRRNRRRSSHERHRAAEQQRQRHYRNHQGDGDDELDDSPDEFEQIKETFTQGLEEAKSTLNGWVSNIAKRFEGNNDGNNPQQRRNDNPKLFGALGGSSFNDNKRKTNRFDEDPEILSNDFHDGIRLQDNDDHGPSLPNRPKGELQSDTPTLASREKGPSDKKKWQPLESGVSADPDAFLVTDSEEDGDDVATTDATKNTTIGSTKK